MRPTREGGPTPDRRGLVYVGVGVDPGAPITDPAPPFDRASTGVAYIPFLNAGEAGVAQWKSGQGIGGSTNVTIVLDDAPTVGNVLVAFIGCDDDAGPTYTLTNGTWTQVGTTVYAGNGTNWPLRMFRQTVDVTTAQSTYIDSFGGSTDTGTVKAVIVELSGVDVVDADIGSATNTATTTDTITPTAALPAVILSGVFARNGSAPALAAAGSMTELVEQGTSRPLAVNQQTIASTTGSYTVGSTGASANSAMIAAAFEDTGDTTIWVPAPLTVDDNDATFASVLETSIDAAGDVFWRGVLPDTFLISSISVRLGMEDAGANTVTVQAGNLSDYSDVVTIATIPFTATGSYTAQDVIDSWTATTVYRYWQLLITTSSGMTLFEVELFDADTDSGGVTVHDDLTGRDAADQHPADAVTLDDADGWFEAVEVEGGLGELAAKVVGYQAHGNTGTTETFDAAIGWHSATLNDDCTFTLTANPTGTVSSLVLELLEDGTGGRVITLPASVVNKTELEADQDTTLSTTSLLVLLTRDGGTTWYGGWWGGSGGSDLTVSDEGVPLATFATTLDFVGGGVVASGTGATKTITITGGTSATDVNLWRPLIDSGTGAVITDGTGQAVMAFGAA